MRKETGFNPLWINTALKQTSHHFQYAIVSIPYGLTLLSNTVKRPVTKHIVSIPYGLTLLSNRKILLLHMFPVSIPYGLTLLSNPSSNILFISLFQSPMD